MPDAIFDELWWNLHFKKRTLTTKRTDMGASINYVDKQGEREVSQMPNVNGTT